FTFLPADVITEPFAALAVSELSCRFFKPITPLELFVSAPLALTVFSAVRPTAPAVEPTVEPAVPVTSRDVLATVPTVEPAVLVTPPTAPPNAPPPDALPEVEPLLLAPPI